MAAVAEKDLNDFIFIDESGANTAMTNDYGRAEGGNRIKASKPGSVGEKFSIIGAISIYGIIAITYGKWATNTECFIEFIKTYLIKKLRKGQIVFLDNVKFHKNAIVRSLIEATGALVVFLPPYSPDLSPIENMWSKLKHYLKKLKPRSAGEFHNALVTSISELDDNDFEEWFEHCGYQMRENKF